VTTTLSNSGFYTHPQDYLQQGDIFRVQIVAPDADETQRIFRAGDGRHGSVVFDERCEARIFSRSEIENLLANSTRTLLHTDPFRKTPDGSEEMVVVFARLMRYFVLVSNTCDISGLDREPTPYATILPVRTLYDICTQEPRNFPNTQENTTIHNFISKHYSSGAQSLQDAKELRYGTVVKQTLKSWIKTKPNKNVLEDARFLQNFLFEYYKKGYLHSLPEDNILGVPESCVDFTSVFTIPTSKLLEIKANRFVRIADKYLEAFAKHFGDFFARIATPKPMRPENI